MHRTFTKAAIAVSSAAVLAAAATAPAAADSAGYAGTTVGTTVATAPVLYKEAAGLADCSAGLVCLWQNSNYTGVMVAWWPPNYNPDFRTIKCSACSGGDFNDDASAWASFTDRNYCVSWDINGGNPDNTMPVGLHGPFTPSWDNRASSISNIGCP
ncbi:peptidase inhibitor family I36 protein [Amycolatopsis sp. NPDC051102]|uniref:peptidase inhibitor family I36 protein n=1 Tax=Amycolatopsis sp. NPDC051102 TaxID=3155163 RepID=UPI00341CCD48